MDVNVRFCVGLLLVAVVALSMAVVHSTWLLVPVLTAVSSWVAYQAAVRAAIAYGHQLHVAFDLHRFDLLRGLYYPLLVDPTQE